jgi:hypothetical protein
MKYTVLLAFLLFGCADECESNEMECNGTVIELCDGGGDWRPVMDCNDMELECFVDTDGEGGCK